MGLYSKFGRKEFIEISGRKTSLNIAAIITICTITIFCLGAVINIQSFLEDKMNDDYVKTVPINIPISCSSGGSFADISANIESNLKIVDGKGKFDVQSVYEVCATNLDFKMHDKNQSYGARVACVKSEKDILWNLVAKKKEIFITPHKSNTLFNEDKNGSIVISENFAKKVFASSYDDVIHQNIPVFVNHDPGDGDQFNKIPVSAIVQSLPLQIDAVISNGLYNKLKQDDYLIPEDELSNFEDRYWISDSDYKKLEQSNPEFVSQIVSVSSGDSFVRGITFQYPGSNEYVPKGFGIIHYLSIDDCIDLSDQEISNRSTYKLITTFNNLDSVRLFSKYLEENTQMLGCASDESALIVDLSSIESKESIDVINGLSVITIVALYSFSVLLIISFCLSIMRLHIEKNKPNLGTLKAFGLSNKKVLQLYASVTFSFIGIAFLFGFLFNEILGNYILNGILSLMNLTTKTAGLEFSNMNFLLSFLILVCIPVSLIMMKIRLILKSTPGALVFQRDQQ
ncbi:MAG: hypothetical protein CL823_05690 [Crocinitomicaceae bacterium]|nr:hypothetical protein [Crocinitomicaceae bacterium]|tara:strand:- start:165 stop:1703 length:1539 start_codon:yes stop_codon:yes gene_type:complete